MRRTKKQTLVYRARKEKEEERRKRRNDGILDNDEDDEGDEGDERGEADEGCSAERARRLPQAFGQNTLEGGRLTRARHALQVRRRPPLSPASRR